MHRLVAIVVAVAIVIAGCDSGPSRPTADGAPRSPSEPAPAGGPSEAVPGDLDDRYQRTSDLAGRWLDDQGAPVPDGLVRGADLRLTLQVGFGPEHCGREDIELLDLAWPVGSAVTTYTEEGVRQYARDVDGVLGERLRTTFTVDATPPEGTVDTGYHRRGNLLLVGGAGAEEAVYVERPDGTVERWPRVVPPAVCL